MAPHSSTLAWNIPWAEEPGRLQSMGSLRVRHDWMTSLSLFTFMHWRRKWQPTPVLWPGESHGQRSLAGYSAWGPKVSDMTETAERAHTHAGRGDRDLAWDLTGWLRCPRDCWGNPSLAGWTSSWHQSRTRWEQSMSVILMWPLLAPGFPFEGGTFKCELFFPEE